MLCQADAIYPELKKLFTVADWALLKAEMFLTAQIITFGPMTHAMKLGYLAIPVWGAAMTCIKISVALALLRIPVNRLWTVFLYSVTAVQVAYFIGNTIFIFLACRPLHTRWDFRVTDGYCVSPQQFLIASNVGSVINITTDLLLSLAPMVMLWNLHRPLRERILVCCLMGIGLLASGAGIVKAVIVRQWDDTDNWALAMSIATWTIAEQLLGVLGACSPSLKGPLEKLLRRFGVFIDNYNSQLSFVPGRWLEGRDIEIEADLEFPSPAHFQVGPSMDKIESGSSVSKSRSECTGRWGGQT